MGRGSSSEKQQGSFKTNNPGLGAEYEVLLPAHLALQFFKNEEIHDFQLRSNVQGFDKFDDVLIDLYMKSGYTHHFAIQLKHKEKNVKLQPTCFHTAKDFNLEKYCEAYNKVIKNEEYNYMIYTNADFSQDKIKEVTNYKMTLSEDCFLKKYFNTSNEEGSVYKFDVNEKTNNKDDFVNFFPHFSLFVGQKNSKCLEEEIKNIFKTEYAVEDVKVSTEYINLFRKWHKKEFIDDLLDRKTLSIHFIDLILGNYIMKPSVGIINRHEKLSLLEESVRAFNVTIIEDLKLKLLNELGKCEQEDSLPYYIESLLMKFADDFQVKGSNLVNQCLLRLAKLYKFVDKFRRELEANEKRKMFNYLLEKPLLIVYNEDSKEIIGKALQMHLIENTNIKFILVGKNGNRTEFENLRCFKTLQDLSNKNQILYENVIEKFEMSLQGRENMKLNKIITQNYEISELIQVKHLFQDNIMIGEKLETLPEYYIPRTVSTIIFNEKDIMDYFLKKNHLLIIDYGRELDYIKRFAEGTSLQIIDIDEFIKLNEKVKTGGKIKQRCASVGYIITTKEGCIKQKFEEICLLPYDKISFFKINEEHKFMLINSRNSNKEVYSKGLFLEEAQIPSSFCYGINVLCAEPGMGKTSIMKSFRNRCPSNHWTVFLELKQFKSLFVKFQLEADEILKQILEKENEDPIVIGIRNIFLNKRKISLFLDGLDELDSGSTSNVLWFIVKLKKKGFNVWLSSRNSLKEKIESELNLFTIDINELSEEQQSQYIHSRLEDHKNYSNDEIDKIIKSIFASVSVKDNSNILGIPLQLFMVTQIFIDEKRNNLKLNENLFVLTKLYSNYFHGKIKHTLHKKGLKDELEIKKISKQMQKRYQISGLKSSLDNEDFEKLHLDQNELKVDREFIHDIQENGDSYGIIKNINEDNTATFMHHTHGEYFAVIYFTEKFDKLRILKDSLFTKKYENLRLLFDIKLAENCPLHLSVIYKNFEQFNKHLENFDCNDKDKGGRTPLHLACTYATRYSSLDCEERPAIYYYDVPNVIETEDISYMRLILKLANLCRINQRDQVFNWNEMEYGLKSWCLYPLEAILRIYHTRKLTTTSNNSLNNCHLRREKILLKKRIKDLILNQISSVVERGSMAYYAANLGYVSLLQILFACNKSCVKLFKYNRSKWYLNYTGCQAGQHKIAFLLSENKADVNCKNEEGCTPLHLASMHGCNEVALSLIQNNANINARDEFGCTPLHYACEQGHHEAAILLIENDARVHVENKFGCTPLHYACQKGLDEVAVLLIKNKAMVNARDKEGYTPFHYACQKGQYNLCLLLIENEADVHVVNKYGYTSLHYACQERLNELALWLIENKANVNAVTETGNTPLHYACQEGLNEVAHMLINNDANANAINKYGYSPLHYACERRLNNIALLLIKNNAKVNVINEDGFTPLHYACQKESNEIVLSLINNNATVNNADECGCTPLHYACEKGLDEVALLLIRNKAIVNAVNEDGDTALHYACQKKQIEVARVLIENNANVNAVNRYDYTPLHYACREGLSEVVLFLIQNSANVNAVNKVHYTPLHYACGQGYYEVALLLIKHNADVNATDLHGITPLHYTYQNVLNELTSKLTVMSIQDSGNVDIR